MHEKGKQSFVSFIKAYSKNECNHIFKVKELDFIKLAKGFGLLQIPRMPEVNRDINYTPLINIDISKIQYK